MKRKQRAELAKRNIGMVFQSYHLLDDLTVQENIDLPLSYKDIPRSERQGLVADTLDRFQIVAKKDLYPSQLSGGQQQLVGIARAVIHKPALLLADEPTGNLHSSQAKEIMELFRELNQQGTTIVQVTHSETNAAYGNRTIQLRDGWMVGRHGESCAIPASGGQRIVSLRLQELLDRLLYRQACGLHCRQLFSDALMRLLWLRLPATRVRTPCTLKCRNLTIHSTPTCRIPFPSQCWPIPRASINWFGTASFICR